MNQELQKVIKQMRDAQREGYVIASRNGVYTGLDAIYDLKISEDYVRRSYGNYDFTVKSPFCESVEKIGHLNYVDIYKAKPGQGWPDDLAIDEREFDSGIATVNWETHEARIQGDIYSVEIPKIHTIHTNEWVMINDINQVLSSAHSRIFVHGIAYTGDRSKYREITIPKVANDQVTATLTGYALTANGEIVYMGYVAYRFSLDSIRATIIRNRVLNFSGVPAASSFNSIRPRDNKYKFLARPIPELGETHATLISREAWSWQGDDVVSYALAFGNMNIQEVFYKRLTQALPIPLLPEWTQALWDAAKQKRILHDLHVWGDCVSGVQIDITLEKWDALIRELLKSRTIIVTSPSGDK